MIKYGAAIAEVHYAHAVILCAKDGVVSIQHIAEQLGIGFQIAARIVERMERRDFCARADNRGHRKLLVETQCGNKAQRQKTK